MANKLGTCGDCRHWQEAFCRNSDAPHGGLPRLAFMGCWGFSALSPETERIHYRCFHCEALVYEGEQHRHPLTPPAD